MRYHGRKANSAADSELRVVKILNPIGFSRRGEQSSLPRQRRFLLWRAKGHKEVRIDIWIST
jgi:hypothetical protein